VKIKLGFIGGGNMASSIIGGLLNANSENSQNAKLLTHKDIWVFEPNNDKAQELNSDFKINLADNNIQLLEECNIVVIAVKPQALQQILEPLKNTFKSNQPLIISIAAGIRSKTIEQWLDDKFAIVRVMPNTPALVGAGASGLFANQRVSLEQKEITLELLNSIGINHWVQNETDIDTVTALSGSGPAYFMLFIKSLIEAAEAAGLDHHTAKELAVATASGSAKLIANSNETLETLINNVTSPGGTTEQALLSFNSNNLPIIINAAFEAARQRSEELAEQLGNN